MHHISQNGFEAWIQENPDKAICNLQRLDERYHCPCVLKNICYGMTLTYHEVKQTMTFIFCSKECYKIADHHFEQIFGQGNPGHLMTWENRPEWWNDE